MKARREVPFLGGSCLCGGSGESGIGRVEGWFVRVTGDRYEGWPYWPGIDDCAGCAGGAVLTSGSALLGMATGSWPEGDTGVMEVGIKGRFFARN